MLRAVGSFEVVYVANSESVFPSVKKAFWSRFSTVPSRNPGLFGEDVHATRPSSRLPLQARFTTVLFRHGYPAMQRSKRLGSERVRRALETEAGK